MGKTEKAFNKGLIKEIKQKQREIKQREEVDSINDRV